MIHFQSIVGRFQLLFQRMYILDGCLLPNENQLATYLRTFNKRIEFIFNSQFYPLRVKFLFLSGADIMASSPQSIKENFMKAYPNDLILVYKYTPPGGAGSYNGTKLLETKVQSGETLKAFKLTRSGGPNMNSDEIKAKAFPFVYDTRSITNDERRRDLLQASLKNIFPNHNVNVFIFNDGWSRSCCSKGSVAFKNEYGSTIDIVLS